MIIDIAKSLILAQQEKNVSSAEMARRIGVVPQHYNQIRKQQNPKVRLTAQLADALGIDLEQFIQMGSDPNPLR